MPAPMTVPKLKKAWNSGRIVLPVCFSIAAPSTFIITSTAPLPKPQSSEADDDDAAECERRRADADDRDTDAEEDHRAQHPACAHRSARG